MAVTLNANTSTGFIATSDTSGVLQLQTGGTTAVTVDASQRTAFVAGTAALPAITTTGDTNTGIYFPAADTIAFSKAGSEVARFNADGQFGLATTTPDSIFGIGNIQNGTRFFYDRSLYTNIFGGFNHLGDGGGFEFYNISTAADRSIRFSNGTSYAGRTEHMRITNAGAIAPITTVTSGGGFGETISIDTFNNSSSNTIGAANGRFSIVYISQGNQLTVIPIFANAGGGVAWSASMFDPDAGTFAYGSGPSVSFATVGSGANSYTVALSGGTGLLSIQRTAGSAAYTVVVKAIGI
jgi:hypothetical protein